MANSLSIPRRALAVFGGAALLAGCGGGGSGGGVDAPNGRILIRNIPTVQKLETALGLAGSRGSGADVLIAYNVQDKEFNPVTIQIEYGWDVDGDGEIVGSNGDPSPTDEYFPCTESLNSDGTDGLDTAAGRGADHLFVWASATDLPAARFATLDYLRNDQGRLLDPAGNPTFSETDADFRSLPGLRVRMRANDSPTMAESRWSPWARSKSFDLNNNQLPAVTIDPTGLFGVRPNATGVAADENVVLDLKLIDADSALSPGVDLAAVFVDYAEVPGGTDLNDPAQVAALIWYPATRAAGSEADTGLLTAPAPGVSHTFTWDSVRDVGTTSADYILRATAYDSKSEVGATVMMAERFRLDNYTVFTDAGDPLPVGVVGHRATLLDDGRVLVSGGQTTAGGAAQAACSVFIPGVGQTIIGAVAATGSMANARWGHSATRLYDGRVLVAGGFSGASALTGLELFDPTTNTWSATSALATARGNHTAVLLDSGDVLFVGGRTSPTGSALASGEVWRVETGTVAAVSNSMTDARYGALGASLPGGKVLIPFGTGAAGALSSTVLYDPATNAFSDGPTPGTGRAGYGLGVRTDGKVLVVGGGVANVDLYDPRTDTWSPGPADLASARADFTGVYMGDGQFLVAGGTVGGVVQSDASQLSAAGTAYDAANGPMVVGRRNAEAVLLPTGRVLITGGLDATGATVSMLELFTPDAGFNYAPTVKFFTPVVAQSWALGTVIDVRMIDPEGDRARVLFQYSYRKPDLTTTPWRACTPAGGPYRDAVEDTAAGDVNHGIVDLETTTADNSQPIDWSIPNSAGDHLFVWDTSADIPRADYDSVRVRCIGFGGTQGAPVSSFDFAISYNTRVIPRFADYSVGGPYYGTVRIDYHLQDLDGNALPDPWGDMARVTVEYGIDANGDRQITGTETWNPCYALPGSDPIGSAGTSYPLATTKAGPGPVGTDGWHVFTWDSVRDLGVPAPNVTRNDIMLRIVAYDFPAGTTAETIGLQALLGTNQGFDIVIPPNGLYLNSLVTEGGQTYTGTTLANVRLDEDLAFNFSANVDPASISPTTLAIRRASNNARILGDFEVQGSTVYFHPQVNGFANGGLTYNGSENPTVQTRNVQVRIDIPAYTAGTDPSTANVLRILGPAGPGAADIVNLIPKSYNPCYATSGSAGTAAYYPRSLRPTVTTASGSASGFTVNFDYQIDGASVAPGTTLKFVVDLNGNNVADANDSIVPGTVSVVNTAGPSGVRQSVLTFTPLSGVTFPSGSKILASFVALAAGDGALAQGAGGGAAVASFTTAAGTTTTTTFTEGFDNTNNRDAANTTALWNNAAYLGRLTGMRDGGTGADGNPTSWASLVNGVRTFTSKNVWNFSSFSVPRGEIWRFTGTSSNLPVNIFCTTSVDIAGVVDVSGGDGGMFVAESTNSTFYYYGKRFTSAPSSGGTALAGGIGVAGGGAGGNSRHFTQGLAGTNGYGVTTVSYGQVSASSPYYYYGGGGGGNAQLGQYGGYYSGSTTYGGTGGAATVLTSNDFANQTGSLVGYGTPGSGGAAGSGYTSYTTEVFGGNTYYITTPGGAGGAGGGAIRFGCNTTFTLRGSGVIDASGGNGGNSGYYSYNSAGGGGSGGSVWIQAGGNVTLGGIVDISGGQGGDLGYTANVVNSGNTYSNNRQSACGGAGSAGRVQIEGPNIGTVLPDIYGGTAMSQIAVSVNNGADGGLYGGTGSLGAFPTGSATLNVDTLPKDTFGYLNFTSMSIASGTTITLAGNTSAKMRFTGSVTINGTLRADGQTSTVFPYDSSSYYVSGGSATSLSGFPNSTTGLGVLGGGNGGTPATSSTNSWPTRAGNGSGPGGGGGGYVGNGCSTGSPYYYYGATGGGGGANLMNFAYQHSPSMNTQAVTAPYSPRMSGWPYGYGGYYNSRLTPGPAGVGTTDPEAITLSGITGGSGGGAGANGGYYYSTGYYGYFYPGGCGGGGGGGIGIETAGTFTMGSTGILSAQGGAGQHATSSYYPAGGGGGSGGSVLVRANTLSMSNGSRIDTRGGYRGKDYYGYNYAYYFNYPGVCGGEGGLGCVRIQAVNTNPASYLFNRANLQGYNPAGGVYPASWGTLTTKSRVGGGDTGLTTWQTAAGLAPDFYNGATGLYPTTPAGTQTTTLEGAMSDPLTGLRSTTLLGSQVIGGTGSTALTQGLGAPNAIDGYKFWRLRWTLFAGATNPEVYDTAIRIDTK